MHYKWQLYYVLFLKYQARQTDFFVIFGYFLHFYPSNNAEDQNFDKMKKTPRDIVILHMCTINEVPKMKIIRWMIPKILNATDRIFSHFRPFFALFNFWKNEEKKTTGYIIILQKSTINDNHTIYGSWDMKCNRHIYCHFGPFFACLPQ